jgi:hypothetical protein
MITSQTSTVAYFGNGVATIFAYGFPVTDPSQIQAVTTDPNGNVTTLVLGSDYTVNGVGNADQTQWYITYPISGGTILPTGWLITIGPNFPLEQLTDFENQGGFFPKTVEACFDYVTLLCQQLQAEIARAITIPIGSTSSPSPNTLIAVADAAVAAVNAIIAAGGVIIPSNTIAGNVTGSTGPATGQTPITVSNLLNIPRVDVASATTTPVGAAPSNYVRVTGTTTVTGFDVAASGVRRTVLFGGILTLTYNSTSLILPTAANIATAAGDIGVFLSEGGGNWRCVDYQTASGIPLALPAVITPTVVQFTAPGASTWTCPVGVTKATVTVIGGGGGAQAASANQVTSGGAGGGMAQKTYSNLVPGTVYNLTVGAGTAGAAGGSSSFVGPTTVTGGGGGAGGASSATVSTCTNGPGLGTGGDLNLSGVAGSGSFYSSATINLLGAGGGNGLYPSTGTGAGGVGVIFEPSFGVGSIGQFSGGGAQAGQPGTVIIEY